MIIKLSQNNSDNKIIITSEHRTHIEVSLLDSKGQEINTEIVPTRHITKIHLERHCNTMRPYLNLTIYTTDEKIEILDLRVYHHDLLKDLLRTLKLKILSLS